MIIFKPDSSPFMSALFLNLVYVVIQIILLL